MQLDEREAALRAAQRDVEQLRAQMAAWRASVAATEAAIRADADTAAKRIVRLEAWLTGLSYPRTTSKQASSRKRRLTYGFCHATPCEAFAMPPLAIHRGSLEATISTLHLVMCTGQEGSQKQL